MKRISDFGISNFGRRSSRVVLCPRPKSAIRNPKSPGFLALLAACLIVPESLAGPPTLDHLFPAGIKRGASFEVTASGKFDRWPVNGWTSSPGLTVEPSAEKGKLTVTASAEAPVGVHWLRLRDDEGASAPRPFVVGLLPEVAEVEPNDEPGKAQQVGRGPVTINGRFAKNGDVDGFAIALKAGETLVAALVANRDLGSPIDAVLQVASPEGFVLAQVDDEDDRDPRIVFRAPRDGEFLVRAFAFPYVQDSNIRFSGGPAFIYRLTLTAGPFVDHAFPLAVARDDPGDVEWVGWNLGDATRSAVEESGESSARTVTGVPAGSAEVRVVDVPAVVEREPNDPAHPQAIPSQSAVSGRIDRPGDVDAYSVAARKGDRLSFRVESRSIGRPLDATLRVLDEGGKVLSEVDDVKGSFDPEIKLIAPADGTYRAVVADLNGRGGPRHSYLLTVGDPAPDFSLQIDTHQVAIREGQGAEVPVNVARRGDYAGPIVVELAEHPEGVAAAPVTSEPTGPSARSVTLRITHADCEGARSGPIRIVGVGEDGRVRSARAPVAGFARTIEGAWLAAPKSEGAR